MGGFGALLARHGVHASGRNRVWISIGQVSAPDIWFFDFSCVVALNVVEICDCRSVRVSGGLCAIGRVGVFARHGLRDSNRNLVRDSVG